MLCDFPTPKSAIDPMIRNWLHVMAVFKAFSLIGLLSDLAKIVGGGDFRLEPSAAVFTKSCQNVAQLTKQRMAFRQIRSTVLCNKELVGSYHGSFI